MRIWSWPCRSAGGSDRGIRLATPEPPGRRCEGDRLVDGGLAGEEGDLEPFGTVIALAASSGRARVRKGVGLALFGDLGPGVVEPEVVEVDVPPTSGVVVDQADEDLFAQVWGQVEGQPASCPRHRRPTPGDDHAIVRPDRSPRGWSGTTRRRSGSWRTASTAGTAPTSTSLSRRVATSVVRADPEPPGVAAFHVPSALRDGIPSMGGPAKASPSACQSLSVPVSKSEVERSTLASTGPRPRQPRVETDTHAPALPDDRGPIAHTVSWCRTALEGGKPTDPEEGRVSSIQRQAGSKHPRCRHFQLPAFSVIGQDLPCRNQRHLQRFPCGLHTDALFPTVPVGMRSSTARVVPRTAERPRWHPTGTWDEGGRPSGAGDDGSKHPATRTFSSGRWSKGA